MKAVESTTRWGRLGDYIEHVTIRCGQQNAIVSGVDIHRQFIETRANLEETDVSKYSAVPPDHFACNLMHVGRDERLPIAWNDSGNSVIVTSAYYVFRIRMDKQKELLSAFLFAFFNVAERDRLAWFYTDSSVRGNLKEDRFFDIRIPLPSIEEQRRIVAAWRGLRNVKEQNEALAEPLLALCQSRMEDLKKRATAGDGSVDWVALGDYIEPCDERNDDLSVKLSQGIANFKEFQNPKQVAANSRADRIVRTCDFAYNRATTRNGEKISIAYREGPDCTVSGAYQVFRIAKPELLEPMFLLLWFKRSEFDRYARYMSKGSAHEFFEYDDMSRVRIPLPRIEEQRRIVAVYEAAREAKRIAEEAGRLSESICPALMRRAEGAS